MGKKPKPSVPTKPKRKRAEREPEHVGPVFCGRCGMPYPSCPYPEGYCPACGCPEFSLRPGPLTEGWKRWAADRPLFEGLE